MKKYLRDVEVDKVKKVRIINDFDYVPEGREYNLEDIPYFKESNQKDSDYIQLLLDINRYERLLSFMGIITTSMILINIIFLIILITFFN